MPGLCPPGNFAQIGWERHPLGDDGAEPERIRTEIQEINCSQLLKALPIKAKAHTNVIQKVKS